MSVTCFLLLPQPRWRVSIRRFRRESASCSGPSGYCEAKVHLLTVDGEPPENELLCVSDAKARYMSWPKACSACGHAFGPEDFWQKLVEQLYRNDLGIEWTLHEAPPGAMWQAPWLADHPRANGKARAGGPLLVRLPDGRDWLIDGQSTDGGYWNVEGEPPRITARPSIATGTYHGFLSDGELTDDLDGRRYGAALDRSGARG